MTRPPRQPKPRRHFRASNLLTALILAFGGWGTVGELRAQAAPAATQRLPEIKKVELRGVRSVPVEQLRLAMSTKSSYCRLQLLAPICWVVRTPFFVRRHDLEPGELERDIVALRGVYWQRGFREARIDTVVTPGRRGLRITFVVHEGAPTIVDAVDVREPSGLLTPEVIARAVRLRVGSPLDLASLDTGLVALRNAIWDAGHGDATLDPDLKVNDETRRAQVRIVVDPRWRTRVGSITLEGNARLADRALRSALTLRPGSDFRRRDVLESQKYLHESLGIASAVIISPPDGDSIEHVTVRIQENPPRRVSLTAGINTIEFGQLGARAGFFALGGGRWQLDARGATGNLFARQLEGAGPFADVDGVDVGDGGADGAGELTRPTWQGSVELTRLWAGSPRNRFTVGAFSHRRAEPSVFVDRGTGGFAMFTRELAARAPVTAAYRFERSAVEAGDVYFCQTVGICGADVASALGEPRRLATVALNTWLDRSNDAVAPSRGYTLRADFDHASAATGSEFRHDRIAAEATTYISIGSPVLAARARAGWVGGRTGASGQRDSDGDDVGFLHPRALFYAGGVESVRGYGENQLGPRVLRVRAEDLIANGCSAESLADASCDPNAAPARAFSPRPVGATRFLEGSIELRVPLTGSIGAAAFTDAAVLSDGADGVDGRIAAITPGAGLRYESNVGTLRLDVGWRPRGSERVPVVVATRQPDGTSGVTRLSTTRQWTEGDGERGVLRRVALHFVLGHAF